MKTEVYPNNMTQVFKPFRIVIDVESKTEAIELFHLFRAEHIEYMEPNKQYLYKSNVQTTYFEKLILQLKAELAKQGISST